ncbi:MAG: class I adenylate-forming enzyme family protein [Burkholderiales bacterium]
MPTLDAMFRRACRWRGAAEFLVDPGLRVSGRAAAAHAGEAAAALAALGVRPGDVVAFLCRSSVRHALAYFGALGAGAVVCNLHVRETPAALADTVAWLGARLVIADADLEDGRAALARAAPVIALDDARLARGAPVAPPARRGPDDLAAIVLSSGSTGRPKGVMHSHRTLLATAQAGQQLYAQITPHDTAVVTMAASFAAWAHVVLPYVAAGAKVVFAGAFDPAAFLHTLAAERVTMAPLVPTMWRRVLAQDFGAADLGAVRVASISGEPPARGELEGIQTRVCRRICALYLASEGGNAAGTLATDEDLLARGKTATSGKPVAGADLRIVDPAGGIDAELPAGEVGEIAVTGASLALGYWRDEALTRARFVDGWWRSGDLGRLDADGDLFVEGRIDNLINSGGIKVHAEEVERALLAHPRVALAAVVGVPDPTWGQRIEAHVVPRDDALTAAEVVEFCRAALAAFKVPRVVHLCGELPLGPTGKLFRPGLRAPRE